MFGCMRCLTGNQASRMFPRVLFGMLYQHSFVLRRWIREMPIYRWESVSLREFCARTWNTSCCIAWKTADCPGFGIIEAGDVILFCSICKQTNCLQCKVGYSCISVQQEMLKFIITLQAIHKGTTCEDYQDSLTGGFKMTERYIDNLKNAGDVMNCPKCKASFLFKGNSLNNKLIT